MTTPPKHIQDPTRSDYRLITRMIPQGSRVLDLGCGTGELLQTLMQSKGVRGNGIEISEENVIRCLEKGISVYQGDIDEGLADYPDHSYDYVIMNQTLQVIQRPLPTIHEMLRVGKFAVIGFPNFGYWEVRLRLACSGKMPVSSTLPFTWYDTPNIHLFTIEDFRQLCKQEHLAIEQDYYAIAGQWTSSPAMRSLANLLAETAVFVVTR